MSGIKISSKRAHLGFVSKDSNLDEDEGMRRRTSVSGLLNIKGELEEAYGREFDLGGP